jgi:hypothetical protein
MQTIIKDGVITTVTPYDLEVVTNANLYEVYSFVRNLKGKVIYKRVFKLFSADQKAVIGLHLSSLKDFLILAKESDLLKPLNF